MEKSQPDDGSLDQAAAGEVHIAGGDCFVEAGNALMKLRTDAANQPVAEAGQFAERQGGA